jgi:cellulose synthase/poly-beta-1,6-N-acetylglucosamine synthase-like glycosyltransferase
MYDLLDVLTATLTTIIGLMGTIYLTYYLYMLGLVRSRPNSQQSVSSEELPHISVIVPTFNEENTIEGKLQDLLGQEYPLGKMEVIVMDSGSNDRTPSIVDSFAHDHKMLDLRLIRETERRGKSVAMNIAIHEVGPKSEIIVITDSDSRFGKNSMKRAVESLRDPGVGLVTGVQILANPHESRATMMESSYSGFSRLLRQGESLVDSTPISDGFLACRKSLIQRLSLRTDLNADDTQLAILTRRNGLRSIYNPDAPFYEFAPPDVKEIRKQKVRRGQGIARTLWGNRDLVFNRTYGKFGILIIPMNFFMHIISPVMSAAAAMLVLGIVGTMLMEGRVWPLILAITVVVSVLACGKRSRVCSAITAFAYYQLILFEAILLAVMRRSLHKWQKIDSVRNRERWTGLDGNQVRPKTMGEI